MLLSLRLLSIQGPTSCPLPVTTRQSRYSCYHYWNITHKTPELCRIIIFVVIFWRNPNFIHVGLCISRCFSTPVERRNQSPINQDRSGRRTKYNLIIHIIYALQPHLEKSKIKRHVLLGSKSRIPFPGLSGSPSFCRPASRVNKENTHTPTHSHLALSNNIATRLRISQSLPSHTRMLGK